jgi:hypothetical protein
MYSIRIFQTVQIVAETIPSLCRPREPITVALEQLRNIYVNHRRYLGTLPWLVPPVVQYNREINPTCEALELVGGMDDEVSAGWSIGL